MRKHTRTKAELVSEIAALQRRIGELEESAARGASAEGELLQAREEISRRQGEITALLSSFRAILRYRQFKEAARPIFDACKGLIGASAGYVALLAADGKRNEVLLLESGGLPCRVDPSLPMPIRGLRAHAYRTGRVVYDNDFSRGDWTRFLPEGHLQLNNVLFSPLVLDGKALGLVGLANKPHGFTEDDARMASAFGELAAVALQNSRTLEALGEERDFNLAILATIGAVVVVLDREGRIVRFNRACEQTTGYTFQEVEGKPFWDVFLIPEEIEPVKAVFAQLCAGQFPNEHENYWLTRNGGRRLIRWSNTGLVGPNGTVDYLIATGIDVTEQREAEKGLAWESQVNAAIAELSTALIGETSMEEIAYLVLEHAKRLTDSLYGYVGYLDPETGYLVSPTLTRDIWSDCRVPGKDVVFKEFKGLWGWVLEQRKPLMTNQPSTDLRSRGTPPGHVPIRNFLSVPAEINEELVGQIALANSQRGYTERDLNVVQRLAVLYAIAIQRRRVEAALQRSHDELERRVAERTAELARTNLALEGEIAERVKAERLLEERNELLESIFADIHFLIAYMDSDFNFIRVNRAYAAADERDPEFYVGKNHFTLFPDGENDAIFRRVVETGLPHFAFEKPFVYAEHPERGVTYWDWCLQPIKDAESKVQGLILGLVDVTARKRAQLALQASEAKHSTLVENSLTGIFINLDGRIVFANDRFAEIFGYSRDEIIGMEALRLVHPEDRALVEDTRRKRLRGEPVAAEYESRGLTKRGETIWVIRRNTVIDYQGRRAVLGNLVDVTTRRHMEEALRQSESQLRHLSAQLLSAQETERGRIARELHDGIGQWLSAIKFRVEDVLQQVRRRGTDEGVQLLDPVIPLIRKAIDEIRRISMDLRPATLDSLGILATVSWLCREFQGTYRGIRIAKNLTVKEQEVPESLKVVIYRILQEALNNVAKHSGADLVRIHLRKRAGRIELSVRDNGKGFQPAHVLSQRSEKAGYGLASMRERTKLSGGSFLLEPDKGNGTRIQASWPAG